jgi:predicted nucleic acid-binding protein
LLCFYHDVTSLHLELAATPTPEEIAVQARIIDPKDAHVLASAVSARVEVLLTLDRRHFFVQRVRSAALPFSIVTPGDFLRRLTR